MATAAQITSFINQIAPLIQSEAKKRGYKVCSPIIAQACCESAYGTSWISKSPYFNFFGMKCGKSWKGRSVSAKTKEEYTVGKLTTIRDNFRAYDSMDEGVKGYFDFISTKRYSNLLSAETPNEYLERIKADGYATSSKYVQTNMNLVIKHNLMMYDGKQGNPYTRTASLIKRGMKGESVKWLQFELNKHGYDLQIDGDFGRKTLAAVISFQQTYGRGILVDGIAGKQTITALESL